MEIELCYFVLCFALPARDLACEVGCEGYPCFLFLCTLVTSLVCDCTSTCVHAWQRLKNVLTIVFGPSSRMSSQPPNGQSVSPGDRTAAWKMEQPQPKVQVQERAKPPRIDMDEQIEEANRLAALLKKVQHQPRTSRSLGSAQRKGCLRRRGVCPARIWNASL